MSVKKRGLGRGLDALLNSSHQAQPAAADAAEDAPVTSPDGHAVRGELRKLPVEWLVPGRYQPRKDMSSEALEELTSSIRSQGIIQPIVAREIAEQQFEIIAGERRWRAAQLAGLDNVPCLIKDVPDEAAVAMALIENIQREDLNAMEEAVALQRLLNEFELTHQQVADAVGKSRTAITNLLRLNSLQDDVKTLLEHGDLEMGHARCLLALENQEQVEAARTVVAKGLTVRETERLVKRLVEGVPESKKPEPDANIVALQNQLADRLGTQVAIKCNKKGKGQLTISYSNLDELDGILSRIR